MVNKWLNLFFKLSGYVFSLKQKMIKTRFGVKVFLYALAAIFIELSIAVFAFPIYLIVSPIKVQEGEFIFPSPERKNASLRIYRNKRKLSLITFLNIGGFFLLKILLVSVISFYLLGGQPLLAAVQNWPFDVAGDYTYDSAKIEVTGGVARLKNLGSTVSGGTTNPSFNSNTTGWTYADWDQGGGEVNVTGARQTTGGNPGGWINVNFPAGKSDELGGYWRQGFTTTVANPTTLVSFDW